MTLDMPRRTHAEIPKKGRARDVDAAARARALKAGVWALGAGLPIGGFGGYAAGHPVLGMLLGPAVILAGVMAIQAMAGRGASLLYMPSGSSTPAAKGYSKAEALAVRGDYEAAIVAYQAAILDTPNEAEPYLRIARLYRDELKQPEAALPWLRQALSDAKLSRGQEIMTLREVSELLIGHAEDPRRAAPDLARLAEAYPNTRHGAWAREQLARIKADMQKEG
jgi:tetratricopeptide (TPR) repeat protein